MPSVQLKSKISVTHVQAEVVLLDLETGQYFGLNPVGRCVIDGLQQNHSLDMITDSLVSQFEVDRSVAIADLNALLQQLQDANLLARQ